MPSALGLRAGELVEVRSREEILVTLDEKGTLDALPFMPEMLKYCGQRFRVYKRADKTCDTIEACISRCMTNAVHLEGLRCDGGAHDGCQAGCFLFWKEAWLRRVGDDVRPPPLKSLTAAVASDRRPSAPPASCTVECLVRAARCINTSDPHDVTYYCQATELNRATTLLQWWDIRQYIRDLRSGNVRPIEFIRTVSLAALNLVTRHVWRKQYPRVRGGEGRTRTPAAHLHLRPGETVQVKSKHDIEATLDRNNRNRGLSFDREMVRYCGHQYRVLRRVERIVNERNGKMIRLSNDCVVLGGVTCRGSVSQNRLFCPRSIYPFWREIWLTRVDSDCADLQSTAPPTPR
jgi:ferredoxin